MHLPISHTPMIPGNAPNVLEMPSSADAYLGDMSWWLQYSPPRLHAPNAKAMDSVPTMSDYRVTSPTIGSDSSTSAAAAGEAGVSADNVNMQPAGTTNAMPWHSFRTWVTLQLR